MAGPVNFQGLSAAAASGAGNPVQFHSPRNIHSMQVIFTGGSPSVKVQMEGTNSVDANGAPTGWVILGTFDTGAGTPNVSGDIIFVEGKAVTFRRDNLVTLSGGTAPTVTTESTSEGYT